VGVEQGAILALAAGADALCLGHDLEGDAVRSVHDAIVSAVGAGELAEERLAEAAGRVREAGAWSRDAGARPRLDREAGLAAARLALRTEGDPHLGRSAFVVECVPAKTMAADPARHGLGELVRERDPAAAFVRLEADVPDLASLLAAADGRRLVLVVRDAQRHEWERALGERLVGAHPEGVVVDVGYPGWRPEGAAGYITTFGAGRVNLIAAAEVLLLRP
jgi:beta-N-acetylhexosaminidase